jgi:4-aminobutyrate aminotransferase-like enzyme
VEAALKTALLATGRQRIIAFEGGYHGLGHGALNVTHRSHFREPFAAQLAEFGDFVPYPKTKTELKSLEKNICALFKKNKAGAILVEPMQARGGINIPPKGFLKLLRKLCDEHKTLLILDEIYTGFGRTGAWFACEHDRVMPDIICLGKALTGGFPLSAAVGRADVMDAAWPETQGEAIHTSTYLGHPVGCAMALAQIRELMGGNLPQKSLGTGKFLLKQLAKLKVKKGIKIHARGIGLMAGIELINADGSPATGMSLDIIKKMLHRGFILLPEGEAANVISLTPPLTITKAQLSRMLRELQKLLLTS